MKKILALSLLGICCVNISVNAMEKTQNAMSDSAKTVSTRTNPLQAQLESFYQTFSKTQEEIDACKAHFNTLQDKGKELVEENKSINSLLNAPQQQDNLEQTLEQLGKDLAASLTFDSQQASFVKTLNNVNDKIKDWIIDNLPLINRLKEVAEELTDIEALVAEEFTAIDALKAAEKRATEELKAEEKRATEALKAKEKRVAEALIEVMKDFKTQLGIADEENAPAELQNQISLLQDYTTEATAELENILPQEIEAQKASVEKLLATIAGGPTETTGPFEKFFWLVDNTRQAELHNVQEALDEEKDPKRVQALNDWREKLEAKLEEFNASRAAAQEMLERWYASCIQEITLIEEIKSAQIEGQRAEVENIMKLTEKLLLLITE